MSIGPSQRDTDEPEVIEFGIAAFDAHLDDSSVTFPVTSEELIDELGDPDIPIDAHGNTVALSTALESVQRSEFATERELQNELHPVFEAYRERSSSGVLASIRTLLPF